MNNFRRVLLKLSGESLMGAKQYGIDNDRLADYAQDIEAAVKRGIQVAIVIGGGNIFRGLSGAAQGFDRVQGDQMGMLATVINSLALGSALTSRGVKNRVLTANPNGPIGEFYSKRRAIDALEAGEVVILSGGTGNPFSRPIQVRPSAVSSWRLMSCSRVHVSTASIPADPEKDPTATKFDRITYDEIYQRGLKVMDLTATTMCMENNLPIIVFDMDTPGNLLKVLSGELSAPTWASKNKQPSYQQRLNKLYERTERLIAQAASQMEKTVEHLEEALARVRAGKANVKILDGIMVEYYGSPVPLTQVGTVTIPDAKSIVITPWEKGIIRDIERAIINSPLGITPENNGELIRLGIPPLTEDRRRELVKQVKADAENAKVSVRNVRRDTNDAIKKSIKADNTPEDVAKELKAKYRSSTTASSRRSTSSSQLRRRRS